MFDRESEPVQDREEYERSSRAPSGGSAPLAARVGTGVPARFAHAVVPFMLTFASCAPAMAGGGAAPVANTPRDTAVAAKQTMTNADVLEMAGKGVGDDVIIEAIGAAEADFDVSPEAVLVLSRRGVSEAVVKAMVAAMRGD